MSSRDNLCVITLALLILHVTASLSNHSTPVLSIVPAMSADQSHRSTEKTRALLPARAIALTQSTDSNPGTGYDSACALPNASVACSGNSSRILSSSPDIIAVPDTMITLSCFYLCCASSEITWTLDSRPISFSAEVITTTVRLVDPVSQTSVLARSVSLQFALNHSDRIGYYQCHINDSAIGRVASSQPALVRTTDMIAVRMTLRVTNVNFKSAFSDPVSLAFEHMTGNLTTSIKALPEVRPSDVIRIVSFSNGSVVADVLLLRMTDSALPICQQTVTSLTVNQSVALAFDSNYVIVQLDCCPEQVTEEGSTGQVTWPATERGSTASVDCPYGSYSHPSAAERRCQGNMGQGASWDVANITLCPLQTAPNKRLVELAQVNLTATNVANVTSELIALTTNKTAINVRSDLVIIASILSNVSKITANGTGVDSKVPLDVVTEINNLHRLNKTEVVLANRQFNTSNILLDALQNTAPAINPTLSESSDYVTKLDNLFVVQMINGSFPSIEGIQVAIVDSQPNIPFKNRTVYRGINTNSVQGNAQITISIPRETVETVANDSREHVADPVIVVFRLDTFFTARLHENETSVSPVNTEVVKVYFPGKRLAGLDPPLQIQFKPKLAADPASSQCVFFDHFLNGNRGNWSTTGCRYNGSIGGLVTCNCDHMTSFAVLMDLLPDPSQATPLALSVITYIGCGLSLAGLALTLITYLGFKKMRRALSKSRPPKILLCLCMSLMATLIVFLVGVDDSLGRAMCKTNAAVMHYLVLSTFAWTLVEGVNLYLCFVRIMGQHISKFMLKAILGAWGFPVVVVGVTMGIRHEQDYGRSRFCVVTGVSFYVTWLGPICLVLVVNFVIIVLVSRALTKSSAVSKDKRMGGLAKARIFTSCTVLLGLTWALGIFAVGDARLPFQYAFSLVNSLQGFAIFVFYCLVNSDAREEWCKIFKRADVTSSYLTSSSENKSKKISGAQRAIRRISISDMRESHRNRGWNLGYDMEREEESDLMQFHATSTDYVTAASASCQPAAHTRNRRSGQETVYHADNITQEYQAVGTLTASMDRQSGLGPVVQPLDHAGGWIVQLSPDVGSFNSINSHNIIL